MLLLAESDVAAHQRIDHNSHHGQHHGDAAQVHQQTHQRTGGKGDACRDEPSTDDADHSSHTIDRAVACPGAVGQAGAHCHHKGDIGRGQRQLVVGAHDDKSRREYQVDGCTQHVEGRIVGQLAGTLVKPPVNGGHQLAWRGVAQVVVAILYGSHQAARSLRGAKHLVALVLPAQVNRGLHHMMRLFTCRHGDNHQHTGDGQVEERRTRRL